MNEHYDILDRDIISIRGENTDEFLQSLITNDVKKLQENKIIYTCLLNPQGKYNFDFFLSFMNDVFYLEIDKDRSAELIRVLSMYKLRKKISINLENKYKLIVSNSNNLLNKSLISYFDSRFDQLPIRNIIHEDNIKDIDYTKNFYENARVRLGIPEGEKDLIAGKAFPLEYGLDKLNAISFNKGCYVGQEVTARTKYRGVIRKKIYNLITDFKIDDKYDLFIDGKKIGQITSYINNIGIAIVREEDYIEGLKINNIIKTLEDREVKLYKPLWQN